MIVKNPEMLQYAKEVFAGTEICIDVEGERHLGAVVGSPSFKEKFVQKKIAKWVQDVEQLSDIARNEPQLALTAYTKALCMRWSFMQRTISDISFFFSMTHNRGGPSPQGGLIPGNGYKVY